MISAQQPRLLAILGELLRQELQGYIAAQAGVLGLVDHTHPTAAYFLKNLVMADGRTDHKLPPSFRQIGLEVTPGGG